MTTTKKFAYALTVAAGLLVSMSALASDVSSDRHFNRASTGHQIPSAMSEAATTAQPAKEEAAAAKHVEDRLASACSCAHKS